jgi:hypothetical protein
VGKLGERTRAAIALTKPELVAELRRTAARLGRTPKSQDLDRSVLLAVLRRFGSIANARRVAGLPAPTGKTVWTRANVIAKLQALSRDRVRITPRELRDRGLGGLLQASGRLFGGVVAARRAARIAGPAPLIRGAIERWDEDRVIGEIRERHRDGKPLAANKAWPKLVKAGLRYFGSWRDAIEAAGLDYDAIRLVRAPYQRDELLALLRRTATERPDMTRAELGATSFRPALDHHFGSVDDALREAGLESWPVRERATTMTRAEVIARLRARRRAGRPTYFTAVQRDDRRLWFAGILHFGAWERAVAAAGLTTDAPTESWTRESIVAALRARQRQGKSLAPGVMTREAPALYYSTRTYFDTYLDAVREVGDAPWALTRWTRESIAAELRRIAGRSRKVTVKAAGNRLASTARYHFGSFAAACRAAGVTMDYAPIPGRPKAQGKRRPPAQPPRR